MYDPYIDDVCVLYRSVLPRPRAALVVYYLRREVLGQVEQSMIQDEQTPPLPGMSK